MPFDCIYRSRRGADVCLTACAATTGTGAYQFARVERPGEVPRADPRIIDVALLDMHHGWPNLGHDALCHAIQDAVCDLHEPLLDRRMAVRVVSYDVRRGLAIPEGPGGRHEVYLGTGGPGHLDPRKNDGIDPGSQGIAEDPGWEPGLFRLFDEIAAHATASLFGVCHTFGVMCRWLGLAEAVLRPPAKGGKSAGIVENILTVEALRHPWFARFAEQLPDHRRFRVLDSRLYDLIPTRALGRVVPLAWETLGPGGPPGDALTMIEVAREAGDDLPRILGVNHHPEIINRDRQLTALRKQLERGAVAGGWYAERHATLTQPIEDEFADRLLHLTSSYTLLAPLRARLYRAIEERSAALGLPLDLDDHAVPFVYDLAADVPLPLR